MNQKILEDINAEDFRKRFGKSLFEELISVFDDEKRDLQSCYMMLDMQFRMPKQIGDLISKYFYDNQLKSPDDEEDTLR